MATSLVSVANLALSHLGVSRITDFDQPSPAAEAVRESWDLVRDAALRSQRWNFAKHDASLSIIASSQRWQLPPDFLRLLAVNGIDAGLCDSAEIFGDSLRFTAQAVTIDYIRRIEEPARWDASFVAVFSYRLAAAIGPGLAASSAVAESMLQRAEMATREAIAANAIETKPTVKRRSFHVSAARQ